MKQKSTKPTVRIRWTSSAKITDTDGQSLGRGDCGTLTEERAIELRRLGLCRIIDNQQGGDPHLAGAASVEARADDANPDEEMSGGTD